MIIVLGIAATHEQDLALGFAELHEVRRCPPLMPVKVPLGGIPSLQRVDCTTQLTALPARELRIFAPHYL